MLDKFLLAPDCNGRT